MKKLLLSILFFLSTTLFAEEAIVLKSGNHLLLKGPINSTSVSKLALQILKFPGQDILLYIDSPGGSVTAGENLISIMKSSGKKFTCIANTAASMAFVVLQACDTRLATDSAIIMQHEASFGIEGRQSQNKSIMRFIMTMLREADKRQAKRLGMSYQAFMRKVSSDWWLWGKEAVDVNVVDKVAGPIQCSTELLNKQIVENIQIFIFSIKVVYSGCPLIVAPLEVVFDNGGQIRPKSEMPKTVELKLKETLRWINYRDSLLYYLKTKDKKFAPPAQL